MLTIHEINLAGTILIGLGLILQGWFILDLNKRITSLMSKVWLEKETAQGIHGLTGMEGNIGLTGVSGLTGKTGKEGE
jgi:hypothetical protein|tara:strand:+ start:1079 stop:1312 length:234 start_codon:yes stop_codon:yes gene_type:complete